MKTFLPLLLFVFLTPQWLQAQDTLLMNTGNEKIVHIKELNERMLYVAWQKKPSIKSKVRAYDLRNVYSVHFKDSARVITYFQDTATDNFLDVETMGRFVNGEHYAVMHYKAPLVTAGGIVSGAAGILWNPFYGLLVPAAYSATLGAIPVSTQKLSREHPDLYADPYFVEGYRMKARKKKIKNAIVGSLIGIGAAAITTTVYMIANPLE